MPFDQPMAGFPRRRWLGVGAAALLLVTLGSISFVSRQHAQNVLGSATIAAVEKPASDPGVIGKKGAAAHRLDWTATDAGRRLISALQLHGSARTVAVEAALEELAKDPAAASAAGQQLLAREPENAAEYGTVLIGALTRLGEFSTAFDLASSAGPAENRAEWMSIVLGSWVRREPGVGPDLLAALVRQGIQGRVYSSLVQGWAESAPEKLADFALTLPKGENRTVAFNAALDRWILRDPLSAAQWVGDNLADTPEFDHALSTLLARTDTLFTSTETALEWTDGIDDPNLRLTALTHVLKQWAQRDPASALRYAETTRSVDSNQRETLIAALTPKPPSD